MFTNILKGDPMAKQKIDKTISILSPLKIEIKYETNDKGNITVFIRWEGFFNKIVSEIFSPSKSKFHRP